MKEYAFPILVLLGIIIIALTGGIKNPGLVQNQIGTSTITQSTISTSTDQQMTQGEIASSLQNAQNQTATLQQEVTALSDSPYKKQIYVAWGSYGVTNSNQEYIEIDNNNYSSTQSVDITGWTLHSKWSGQTVTIPQSVSLYFANSNNGTSDVILAPGERAFIISGRSPITVGQHVNICSGYLSAWNATTNQQTQFTPSLYTSCPAPQDENLSSIPHTPNNSNCFDLINSLSSCQAGPTLNNTYSYECQQFVETKLNYQSCVDTHKNDSDFYSPKEWYVYLNRDQTLWQSSRYEDVIVNDQNGKLVGELKGY